MMVGQKNNRLTVLARAPSNKHGQGMLECVCDCGKKLTVAMQDWKSGHSKSCGCLKNEKSASRGRKFLYKHGLSYHPLFFTWNNMIKRCHDKKDHAYRHYGARGIRICDRWRKSAEAFFEDMGDKPSAKHSIDRIDNNGDYCPENCRWATRSQQVRNTRVSRYLEYNGEKRLLRDWAELYKINEGTLRTRVDELGWPLEKAFTHPVKSKSR